MANSTINGSGSVWQLPCRGISIIGTLQEYSTYTEFMLDTSKSKFAWVIDASADPTVKSGGALYRIEGKRISKIMEEEAMDELLHLEWSQVNNRPLSTVSAIDDAVGKAHYHDNASVLDKFSVDNSGVLLFDGEAIGTITDLSSLSNTVTGLGSDLADEITNRGTAIDGLRTELTGVINQKVASVFIWKGSKASVTALNEVENPEIGWTYQVGTAEYAWNGTNWEQLGANVDMSLYITASDAATAIATAKSEAIGSAEAAVADEASIRSGADTVLQGNIDAVDAKINFSTAINRIDVYDDETTNVNLMVKPGVYFCSTDSSLTGGLAMTNLPTSNCTGILLVTKSAQLFRKDGDGEGRIYYRYQTSAGAQATSYTGDWLPMAMMSDIVSLDADISAKIGELPSGKTIAQLISETASGASSAATTAKTEAISAAGDLDTALHTVISGEISAAVAGLASSSDVYSKTAIDNMDLASKTDVSSAVDTALSTAASTAQSKANAAQAAAEATAGSLDTTLHTTITGEIATAKTEAISAAASDAASQVASAKSTLETAISGKQATLTAADGIVIDAENNIKSRFVAHYGTTSYDDIRVAYYAGLNVFAEKEGVYARLVKFTAAQADFVVSGATISTYVVSNTNVWSASSKEVGTTSDIATAKSEAIAAAASDATSKANAAQAAAATDAASKADAAQAAAEATAATDATTKANAVQDNLDTHTGNTTVHITAAEREAWNAKAGENSSIKMDKYTAATANNLPTFVAGGNVTDSGFTIGDTNATGFGSSTEIAVESGVTAYVTDVLSDYVTSTSLSTTLESYVTSTSLSTTLGDYVLTTALADYVTTTALETTLGDYVTTTALGTTLADYVTSTALGTTLESYVTSSALSTTLGDYVLTTTLADYVSNTSLATTLGDYVTSTSLTTTLGDYVTSTSLTTTLGDYVTTADANLNYASKASEHTHVIGTDNYEYSNIISGVGTSGVYTTFNELSIEDDIAANLTQVRAFQNGYTIIGDHRLVYIKNGTTYNGTTVEVTGDLTGIDEACLTRGNMIGVIANGNIYVKASPDASSGNMTAIPAGGNLLGSSDYTTSKDAWKQASSGTTFTTLTAFGEHWLAVDNTGVLYTAGNQYYHLQNNNETSGTLNTLTPVQLNNANFANCVYAAAGNYYSLAIQGTVTDGVISGTIYLWGSQIQGAIGDGVSWLHDSDSKFYHAYTNGNSTVYIITSAAADAAVAEGVSVYSFAGGHVTKVGVTAAAVSAGADITVDDVVYTRTSGSDTKGQALGVATPTPLAVPTLAYAYKNDQGAILYAKTDTPAKNTALYSNSNCTTSAGSATAGGFGYLVFGGSTYNRSRYDDGVLSSTVYNNWFKASAGYYHAGALRKNGNGETEVYLWGSNEYGQLGTGYYAGASMNSSTLDGDDAAAVELVNRPMKLSAAMFPYTDVVDITCTHYGTFLTRANGKIYFAGCNKRNYLGTGVLSDDTAFIPKFTALSTRFNGNDLYCETYGSLIVHKTPYLSDNADDLVASVYREPLTPQKLDAAISATHNHSIDTSVIDQVIIAVAPYADSISSVMVNSHNHTNIAALNALSVRGNTLYLNGQPYGGSSSGGGSGTGVTIDETNVAMDTLADVAGLSNLAGGLGLEVLSYRRLNDTDDSAGAIIQVAPVGSLHNSVGRYVDVYSSDKSTIVFSKEDQAKGLYGVPSNGTAGYIHCTKDLITMIESVLKSSSAKLSLYYVDVEHAASPASGSAYMTNITYATLTGYGTLYWRVELGNTVTPNLPKTSDGFFKTDDLVGVGLGTYENNEEKFFDVYLANTTTPVISADDFEDSTYYFEDGTEVTSAASIVIPTGREGDEFTYHTVYDNDSQTGTPIITSEQIAEGLFMKDGTTYVKIRQFMIPETFSEDLFNGSIYIHPGLSNFSGMANQFYEYSNDNTGVAFKYGTAVGSDPAPLEKVIIKLNTAVTNGDESSSSVFIPTPGSIDDPMMAAVYSANRWSTSSVSGEYCASVGFNSRAGGNQTNAFGNFSAADGLCSVVVGNMSFSQGAYNVVSGDLSHAYGYGNIVGGTQNIAVGTGNMAHGYYSLAVGDGNECFGINNIAIGSKNSLLTTMMGSIAIGASNLLQATAKGSVAVGKELDASAEGATIIGQKAKLERFEGTFPGDNTDTLKTIVAASTSDWTGLGYDAIWESNKEGIFFGAGLKRNQNLTTVFPAAFRKYRVRPNIASYFSLAANASGRNSVDPYIFEPFMQWTFTGVINMKFTDPQAEQNDATQFTFSERDGGRVKSFDPGIVCDNAVAAPELDFDRATRWKLGKDLVSDTTITPVPFNFVDGAEAYIVIYPHAGIAWTAFTNNPSSGVEGANSFDSLIWKDNVTPVTGAGTSSGFALVRLLVVDNNCIAEVVADTLA